MAQMSFTTVAMGVGMRMEPRMRLSLSFQTKSNM
jgi:hypothetical protein